MISKLYDMTVTDAEHERAGKWWNNLSNNQMNILEKKHFPTWQSGTHKHMIYQMWEEEGKPEPQELIPCSVD